MSTENKIFTDSVRPEDSVSLSDLKNDGNEVHYAQERDEETVASTITGRSVTKNVAKREAVQQEEVEETDPKEDLIIKQNPEVGTKVNEGSTVTLYIPDIKILYPDFTDGTYTEKAVREVCEKYNVILSV